jgi:L-seryl-tRNA(Ser) seleniumtransferase
MTYAALETVLRLYEHPEQLRQRLPTLRLLTRPQAEIESQARRLLPEVAKRLEGRAAVAIGACASQIGSGALPIDTLPSACLLLRRLGGGQRRSGGAWLKSLGAALRTLPVPIVGRVADDALHLDLRTLEDEAGFLASLDALAC